MGRGARSTVRWKHDRIRSKKLRDKRRAAAGGKADAPEVAAAGPPRSG
jgi:hypothetical protein